MNLKLIDVETGELFETFQCDDAARARAKVKLEAYINYLMKEKGGGYVYVLGTNYHWKEDGGVDKFNRQLAQFGRALEGTYAMVLEYGMSGYLHVHIVAEYMYMKKDLIWKWEECTKIKGVHVDSRNIYGGPEGAHKTARYLSKYLSKAKRIKGVRMFRTSKNLALLIEKYFEKKKGFSNFIAKINSNGNEAENNFDSN